VKSRTLDVSYHPHSTLSFTESYSSTSLEPSASVSSLLPMTQTSSEPSQMVLQEPPSPHTSSVSLLGTLLSCTRADGIAMNRLEIPFLPSLINALILVSIFSTTNSFVFTASRAMFGMSQKGQAPKILGRVNKHGVPWVSVLFVLLIGCLSYLSLSSTAVKFLDWWISLVGSAQLINWAGIGL
jgi:amino acid transporter